MFLALDIPGVWTFWRFVAVGHQRFAALLELRWEAFVVTFAGDGSTYMGAEYPHLRNRNLRLRNLGRETMATSCHDALVMRRPVDAWVTDSCAFGPTDD
jgi:hypothetical protein